jgi:hypothetical protein
MDALTSNRDLPRDSSIRSLDPYMDNDGLIRVGGRLWNSLQSNLYHEENRSNLLDPSFNSVSNSVLYVLTSESGSMNLKLSSFSVIVRSFWGIFLTIPKDSSRMSQIV